MIVVDNDSTDASVASLADLDVTTIAVEVNRGFAAGCNIGYRAGTAPFVLFLNPDARAEPELIGRLRAVLEAAPAAGAVAPRILDEDGNLDFSLRRFPRRRSTFAQALFLHRALPQATWVDEVVRDPAAYERAWSPDWVSGRVPAGAPVGARADRRLRRGVLPLQRGHRSLPANPRRRLRHPLRAVGGRRPPRWPLDPTSRTVADARGRPRSVCASARRPHVPPSSSESASGSVRRHISWSVAVGWSSAAGTGEH